MPRRKTICYFVDANGERIFHRAFQGGALPASATVVPRMPKDSEYWDAATGKFVLDHALHADRRLHPSHIEEAHVQKSIEAVLVLSGYVLTHGLLAAEAAATGENLTTLAQSVYSKQHTFREREVTRRKAKAGPKSN